MLCQPSKIPLRGRIEDSAEDFYTGHYWARVWGRAPCFSDQPPAKPNKTHGLTP